MKLKRWSKSKLFLIPETHDPGKQSGFRMGKKGLKARVKAEGEKSRGKRS